MALAGLGEDALPALVEVLVDPQSPAGTRQEVAHWIRFLPSVGANATSHLPVLIRCLSDPDPFVAEGAAIALGRIGVQPEICVPALVECLTKRIVGRAAIQALGLFGGKAQDALPALRGALNTRDPDIRAVAAKAIRDITATRPEAP